MTPPPIPKGMTLSGVRITTHGLAMVADGSLADARIWTASLRFVEAAAVTWQHGLERDDRLAYSPPPIPRAPATALFYTSEILDALKAMLAQHDAVSKPLPNHAGDIWPDTAAKARKAIAMAEGKTDV